MGDDYHHNNASHNDVFHMSSSLDISLNTSILQNTCIHLEIFRNGKSSSQGPHKEGMVVNDSAVGKYDHKA